jgi:hypothetical protein
MASRSASSTRPSTSNGLRPSWFAGTASASARPAAALSNPLIAVGTTSAAGSPPAAARPRCRTGTERRLVEANRLESDLISQLREMAPDLDLGNCSTLDLKIASQELRDAGHPTVRPDIVDRLVRGIARDGRDESEGIGSLQVRRIDREHLSLRLQRIWQKLAATAQLRQLAARIILTELQKAAPKQTRGKDILVETTLGALMSALRSDLELSSAVGSDPASGPGAPLAARAGRGHARKRPDDLPPGYDDPPGTRHARLHEIRLRAA